MKVLVTVKALDLGRTSEGICSAKFLYCLAKAGLDVVCLGPAEVLAPEPLASHGKWLDAVKLRRVPGPETPACPAAAAGGARSPTGWLRNKLSAMVAYGTGFGPETWREVGRWRCALEDALAAERPDLVFVRGAGMGFEPHLAMASLRPAVPWIANYHDPFPLSLYPEPYRRRYWRLSTRQEQRNAQVLEAATRVAFPSARLWHWMLRGDLSRFQDKGVVVPHLVAELPLPPAASDRPGQPSGPPTNRFVVLHAGTLLAPRKPWGLVAGFRRFAALSPERADSAELWFVGAVNREHKTAPHWADLPAVRGLRFIERRIDYASSLEWIRRAAVTVVLEAEAPESPFFPAKLTDYLLHQKPILALSPVESVMADLLGKDACLHPAEPGPIAQALDQLWHQWRAGKRPADGGVRSALDLETVGRQCRLLFEELRR